LWLQLWTVTTKLQRNWCWLMVKGDRHLHPRHRLNSRPKRCNIGDRWRSMHISFQLGNMRVDGGWLAGTNSILSWLLLLWNLLCLLQQLLWLLLLLLLVQLLL